jgi:hypothetical protein
LGFLGFLRFLGVLKCTPMNTWHPTFSERKKKLAGIKRDPCAAFMPLTLSLLIIISINYAVIMIYALAFAIYRGNNGT